MKNIQHTPVIIYLLLILFTLCIACNSSPKQEEEVDSEWIDSLQHVYQYGVCIDSLNVNEYRMQDC